MEGERNLAMLTVIRFSSSHHTEHTQPHHASETDFEAWQSHQASEILPSISSDNQTIYDSEEPFER